MQPSSPESNSPRRCIDRSARVIAAVVLVAAAFALLPVALHGQRTGAAVAAPPAAPVGATETAHPTSAQRGDPSYFGFLEFDWDRGVPGFDPWLAEGSRP